MDNKNIPYIAYESGMARLERMNRNIWILCIILIVSLIASNVAWICYERQFETEQITQEVAQDINTGDGDATVIGIGDNYGESEAER